MNTNKSIFGFIFEGHSIEISLKYVIILNYTSIMKYSIVKLEKNSTSLNYIILYGILHYKIIRHNYWTYHYFIHFYLMI